jgi:unsaturated rhamnogalacturonyl hydrolase
MGWYAMALVDVLDHFPKNHPRRAELVAILGREAAALEKVQDKRSGVWWLVLDMPGRDKNYLEASASAMFTYAMAKGVRMGYLPQKFSRTADTAWAGIQKEFVESKDGGTNLLKTIGGAGLGGNPYRDGSYDYYVGERVVTNDPKGVGSFLLAAVEMETAVNASIGKGKTVLLDDFFNHEVRDENGRSSVWHYKWDEWDHGGFSLLGDVFNRFGAATETLSAGPTAENLKNADVYIVVDPDTEKESAAPNFIAAQHAEAIADWVKKGGVLVLMGNDAGSAEFRHFNDLAGKFGIRFNEDSLNRVQGNNFPEGRVVTEHGNAVFPNARTLYLKEVSSLTLQPPAKSSITHDGKVIAATAKFGKGTVFAVGDPWLYNEYTDGRKLPAEYQNFVAARDLSRWLLLQSRQK